MNRVDILWVCATCRHPTFKYAIDRYIPSHAVDSQEHTLLVTYAPNALSEKESVIETKPLLHMAVCAD